MEVRNILVPEKESFFNGLVKILGLNGISYVQVDNEIHFQDFIYRLYDKNSFIDISDEMAILRVFYPFQLVSLKKDKEKTPKGMINVALIHETIKNNPELMELTEEFLGGPTAENVFSAIGTCSNFIFEHKTNNSVKKFTKNDIRRNNYKVKQMVNPYKK